MSRIFSGIFDFKGREELGVSSAIELWYEWVPGIDPQHWEISLK